MRTMRFASFFLIVASGSWARGQSASSRARSRTKEVNLLTE